MNIKSSDIKCYRDLAKILSVSPNNFVDVNLLDAVIRIFDMQLRNLIIENIQPDDDVDFNRFVTTDNFEIDYSDEKIIGFILAGGLGSRLSSVENSTPKPLVEIAGKAMLKRVIEKINEANIEQVVVSVYNYKDKLKSYFVVIYNLKSFINSI